MPGPYAARDALGWQLFNIDCADSNRGGTCSATRGTYVAGRQALDHRVGRTQTVVDDITSM